MEKAKNSNIEQYPFTLNFLRHGLVSTWAFSTEEKAKEWLGLLNDNNFAWASITDERTGEEVWWKH